MMCITRYWRHYYEKRRGRLKHGLADYALGLPLLDSDRSVYAYTHTHVVAYTHTHTHTHARTHARAHTHTCTHMHVRVGTAEHTQTHKTHTHTHTQRQTCALPPKSSIETRFSFLVSRAPHTGTCGYGGQGGGSGSTTATSIDRSNRCVIFPHRYRYCYSICLVGVEGVGQACSRSGGGGGGGEGGERRGAIRSMIA